MTRGAQARECARRAHRAEAGAGVEEGGDDGAESADQVEGRFQRGHGQGAERDDEADQREEEADLGQVAVGQRHAIDAHRHDPRRPEGVDHLAVEIFEKDQQPADLDTSRGGAGAAADKHHGDDKDAREVRPAVVVRGDKTRRGADRNDGEGRVAQCRGDIGGLGVVEQAGGHRERDHAEKNEVKPSFLVLFPFAPALREQPRVEHETDRAEQHENDEPPFDGGAPVKTDARILRAEAAGGDGRERVADGVEDGHAEHDKPDKAHRRYAEVDLPEADGGVAHACGEAFTEFARGLAAEEGFRATAAGHRQHGDEKHEDAHAAEPLGGGAPEEQAARPDFHVGDRAGARGGEARGRFENRGGRGQRRGREHVGQRAEQGAQGPTEADDDDGLAAQDFAGRAASEPAKQAARGRGEDGGKPERTVRSEAGFLVVDRVGEATDHRPGHEQKQEADEAAELAVIHGPFRRGA